MASETRQTNSWVLLKAELCKRIRLPGTQASFVLYTLLIVVGFGSLGIFIELFKYFKDPTAGPAAAHTAVYTYFIAIAGGAAMQMTLENEKYLRAFGLASLMSIIVIGVLHWLNLLGGNVGSTAAGILGYAASVSLWWVANARNELLLDFNASDTLGGDAASKPQGDISGFTS